MMFVAGPPTIGNGAIVSRSKKESIRGHLDLQRNQAPLHKPACEFYRQLSERAIGNSTVIDLFACSLDQVGVLEFKGLVSRYILIYSVHRLITLLCPSPYHQLTRLDRAVLSC